MKEKDVIVDVKDVSVELGGSLIHDKLNLQIFQGENLAIVGGSGSGKTTLLREILMLEPPNSGSIKIFDVEVTTASLEKLLEVQKRWGVLFQSNALFSSLTVLENVAFPLEEHTLLAKKTIRELALLKILMVGLPLDAANKYPAELSGGMQKRAGLARAIVMDPEILFLDEPTAGLDPDSAAGLDELILNLQYTLGLTVVLVTHDLDSLWRVSNRVAFLGDKKVLAVEPIQQLIGNKNTLIHEFFNGPRARLAANIYEDDHGKQS